MIRVWTKESYKDIHIDFIGLALNNAYKINIEPNYYDGWLELTFTKFIRKHNKRFSVTRYINFFDILDTTDPNLVFEKEIECVNAEFKTIEERD